MVERTNYNDVLKLEPQTLHIVEYENSDYVEPTQLTSIAPETCVTEIKYKTMICGSCKRIPTEAVVCKEDDCEQYFCSPCVLHIYKLNGPCPMPDCQKTLLLKKPGRIQVELYKDMRFKCANCDSLYTYNDHSAHKAYCLLRAQQCIF